MASFTEENDDAHYLSIFLGKELHGLVALMIHSFIVAVSVVDRIKRRPLTTVDQVITALGVSRVIVEASSIMCLFLEHFHHQRTFILVVLLGGIDFITCTTVYSCAYLSALLSAVFCFKICSFHNIIFQSLKKLVVQRVGFLIVTSVLVSVLLSSARMYEVTLYKSRNFTTYVNAANDYSLSLIYAYYLTLANIVPFFAQMFSSIFLIVFLHLHLHRMKSTTNSKSRLDPIYYVLKSIACCFLTYLLQVLSYLIASYFYTSLNEMLIYIILTVCPCLHSIYLIYSTTRLRNHFSRITHWGTNCFLKRRVP